MPAGRPTDYRPEFCERVIEWGREGRSKVQIACRLDVHRATVDRWIEEHPEFRDAMTRARDLAQGWFEDKGQDGLEKPGFNQALWAKQVSCRFREDYTDTSKQELSGKDGGPIETRSEVMVRPSISREEWLKQHGLGTPAGSATSST